MHKTYHIDSTKRLAESASSTDFQYSIYIPFGGQLRVLCSRAVIPKTYFNLPADSTITLNEGGADINITIPQGNYNFLNMGSTLKTLLDAGGAHTYTITPNLITGKFDFSSSGASTLTSNNDSFLVDLLGLEASTQYTFPFSSANMVSYHHADNLRIHTNMISDTEDILCNIPASEVEQYSYVIHKFQDKHVDSHILNPSRSNIYSFRLCDDSGRVIDLQGHTFSFDLFIFVDVDERQIALIEKIDQFMDYIAQTIEYQQQEPKK